VSHRCHFTFVPLRHATSAFVSSSTLKLWTLTVAFSFAMPKNDALWFSFHGVKSDIIGSYHLQSSLQSIISLNPNTFICVASSTFNPYVFSSYTLYDHFIRFYELIWNIIIMLHWHWTWTWSKGITGFWRIIFNCFIDWIIFFDILDLLFYLRFGKNFCYKPWTNIINCLIINHLVLMRELIYDFVANIDVGPVKNHVKSWYRVYKHFLSNWSVNYFMKPFA